jgi:GNAT superfamily N-acetyltransferase
MMAVGGVYPGESDASDTVVTTAMKPPVIRPARPGDAADLARNWIDAARHYAELDSNAFQVPTVAERQLLRDLGRARLYVDALGVEGSYRRRGVGAQLLRAAEAWGRDKGAVRAVLTTYHASPLSVPFYEQGMGYERRSIVFEKRLE